MISISLCMIVKNESAVLERCLDSYSGLFDEIIIVDTGSTDNTKDIAGRYTDKIYDYEWKDDFADARNFASGKASCDYIFTADADEVLDDINKKRFLDLKSVLLPEIDIVQMKYINCAAGNSVYNSKKELRAKLFKRLRTFEWISPIHETLRLTPIVYDSDIEILHMPQNSHSKRDFSIFVKVLEKGVRLENYVVNMFCKELWSTGSDDDFHMLLPVFETYMTGYTDESCCREVSCVLMKMYRICGMKDAFFKLALAQAADEPSSEVCLEIGHYYYGIEDYPEAAAWFNCAYCESQPILDVHAGGDVPLRMIGSCYEKMSLQQQSLGNDSLALDYRDMSDAFCRQAAEWTIPEEI